MSLALVILALGCLIVAAFLWQRSKKFAADGVSHGGTRIAIVVLTIGGVLLALASQLPVFKA